MIKVPYKSVLLPVITCHHLSLAYHTQKYLIKVLYKGVLLSSKNVALRDLTSLSIP